MEFPPASTHGTTKYGSSSSQYPGSVSMGSPVLLHNNPRVLPTQALVEMIDAGRQSMLSQQTIDQQGIL